MLQTLKEIIFQYNALMFTQVDERHLQKYTLSGYLDPEVERGQKRLIFLMSNYLFSEDIVKDLCLHYLTPLLTRAEKENFSGKNPEEIYKQMSALGWLPRSREVEAVPIGRYLQ